MTGARIDTPIGRMTVGERLEVPRGDQFRNVRVGDIITGRQDGDAYWHEALLWCAWVGAPKQRGQRLGQLAVFDTWTRGSWSAGRWQHSGQEASWCLTERPWFRLHPAPADAPLDEQTRADRWG